MIPVQCACANNKNSQCYGDCSMADIIAVTSNRDGMVMDTEADPIVPFKGMKGCPGYIAPGQPAYKGEPQGDRCIGPEGTTIIP